jgi:hypothetical protein
MRKISIFALLFLACAVVTAQAQELGTSSGSGVAVRDVIHPLAPQQITQNDDPNTLETGTGIACGSGGITRANGWWRLFDLDADHALTGDFCVESLDWGVESCAGAQDVDVVMYCLDDPLPFFIDQLTTLETQTVNVPDGAALEFFNTAFSGIPGDVCCDAETQQLAVGIFAPDCFDTGLCTSLFIGGNKLGQTGPSYLSSEPCGAINPTDVSLLGPFPDNAWLMVVNGDGTGGGDDGGTGDGGTPDDGGVPATTGIGLVLLVLALGGGSAYFLRRK